MISENDVVLIVKSYMGKILEKSEQHDDYKFVSFTKENFNLDSVLFSEINKTIPEKYNKYLNEYSLFCGVCDCIPNDDDRLDPSAFTVFLHNKYKYILDNCLLKGVILTDAEEIREKEAKELLYNDDYTPSEVYLKYIQLKEEILSLRDQLAADQLSSDSMNQKERETWVNEGKKFLLEKISFVEHKLAVEGRQIEIESSIHTLENLHKKNPVIIVDSLKQKISELEEIEGLSIGSSSYLPVQPSPPFHSIKTWQQVTIPKKEITHIVEQLRKTGTSLDIDHNLTQIDFNWSSVYIARNWFDATFFKSNYWTMPNNTIVSHGERPNSGILPAYVKRIVITNNISYKVQTLTPKPKSKPKSKPSRQIRNRTQPAAMMMPTYNIAMMSAVLAKPTQKPKHAPKPSQNTQNKKQPNLAFRKPVYNAAVMSTVLASQNQNLFVAAKPAPKKIVLQKLAYQSFPTKQLTVPNQIAITKVITRSKKQAIKQDQKNLKLYLDYRNFNFIVPKSNMKVETGNVNIEHPLILAFICKRVPLCPNPAGK